MKDSLQFDEIKDLYISSVLGTYGRFDQAFVSGKGAWLKDPAGKSYLDLASGIAVCSLGHSNPELADVIREQARELLHVSNLFYQIPQGLLARELCRLLGGGKVFFCNSGAEANEAAFKLARKFGNPTGRYEILTATNSFHGRTLAGISATGQEKVKQGFEPLVEGFRSVPFNDLGAFESAIGPKTVAVLIEGIQGEGGVIPATPEFLLGLRRLCSEKNLLLLFDAIQCGYYRSGSFMSYERLLEDSTEKDSFRPDAITMAKGLGGGVPIGAMWVRDEYAPLLSAGTHGTTFGGNLLAASTALKALEIIHRDKLDLHVREMGAVLLSGLREIQRKFPELVASVRGTGLMAGMEVVPTHPFFSRTEKAPALFLVTALLEEGLVVIPAGNNVIRFLPALNISAHEIEKGLQILSDFFRKGM